MELFSWLMCRPDLGLGFHEDTNEEFIKLQSFDYHKSLSSFKNFLLRISFSHGLIIENLFNSFWVQSISSFLSHTFTVPPKTSNPHLLNTHQFIDADISYLKNRKIKSVNSFDHASWTEGEMKKKSDFHQQIGNSLWCWFN